jgi:hypothetical protein
MDEFFVSKQWNRTIIDADLHRSQQNEFHQRNLKNDLIRRIEEFVASELERMQQDISEAKGKKAFPDGIKAKIRIELTGLEELDNP